MKFKTLLICTLALGLWALPATAQEEPTTTEEEVVIERHEEAAEALEITIPVLDSLMVGGDVHIDRDGNTIVITGRRGGGDQWVRRVEARFRDGRRLRANRPALMIRRLGRGAHWVTKREIEVDGDSLVVLKGDSAGVERIRVMPRIRRDPDNHEMRVETRGDSMIVIIGERTWSRTSGIDRDRRKGRQEIRGRRGRERIRPSVRIQSGRPPNSEAAEIRRMETRARALAEAVRNAGDDDRAEHETALRTHLSELFDLKLQMEERRLEQEQERLGRMEATVSQRRENRDQIIEDRLNQLLGRGSVYRW